MKPNHACETSTASAIGMPLNLGVAGFYWLDELIAAMMILALVFVIAGVAVLTILLIEHLAAKGIAHLGASIARIQARYFGVSTHLHNHL
jgi:hypothetical protein